MADIHIRREGRAGRITLARPKALNALSYEMCLAIDTALRTWRDDDRVALVLIDAEGDKAFCAGGDIAEMYATGTAGDYTYGRRFWADEYRMNACLAEYTKPVVSLLQGFTMGGGVGVGCHASHRVVGQSSQIAMPECGIGLVPDVGGSYLLARAPGGMGAYLGMTGARMGPGDAIRAGFADIYIEEQAWADVKSALVATGDVRALEGTAAPDTRFADQQATIDAAFGASTPQAVEEVLQADGSDFATQALTALRRAAPLSVACTHAMLRNLADTATIRDALAQEYRFTWRAMAQADFLEGIRAAIIDKDRSPNWRHARLEDVTEGEIAAMLASLGPDELSFEEESK